MEMKQPGTENENRIYMSEFLYIVFFDLMLFAKGIGLYDGQPAYKVFLVTAVLCLCVKFLITPKNIAEWILIIVLNAFAAFIYLNSGEKGFLICTMVVTGMKGVNLKRVWKNALWIWSICFGTTLVLNLTRLTKGYVKVHDKLGLGDITRWALGYTHPNVLHISYLILVILIIYYLNENIKWKHILAMLIGNILIFAYSVSYTGFGVIIICLALISYAKVRKGISRFECAIAALIFPFCMLFSVITPLILNGRVFDLVNKILNTRLYLSRVFLTTVNINVLGNKLAEVTNASLAIDNSYVFGLVIYGVVAFALIGIIYIVVSYYLVKKLRMYDLVIIAIISLAGITEPLMFNTSFKNLSLLILGEVLFIITDRIKSPIVHLIRNDVEVHAPNYLGYLLNKLIKNATKIWKNNKKTLMLGSICAAVILACCFLVSYRRPSCIIAPRADCNVEQGEMTMINSTSPKEYPNALVLHYINSYTIMQVFRTDNIINVTFVQRLLGFIISGGLLGFVLTDGVLIVLAVRTEIEYEKKDAPAKRIVMIGHKRIPSREGGVEIVVENLATKLTERGYYVEVYNRLGHHLNGAQYDEDYGIGDKKYYQDVRVRIIPTFANSKLNAIVYSFNATLRSLFGNFDIYHIHAEGPCVFLWILKLFKKRIIVTIHGLDWQRSKWGGFATRIIKYGEKQAAKYADEIIVLSKNVQEYFRATYNRETTYVPNGVEIGEKKGPKLITEKYGLKGKDYILFLARIVPEKGVHYLLEAFKDIDTDMKLVIAGGNGQAEDYRDRISRMASEDNRVILTGFVQGQLLEELYSNAFLYVLPSDVEGMALTLLEAISYGNTCLVSDISENIEVITDDANQLQAFTFEHSNVESLKTQLTRIISDNSVAENSLFSVSEIVTTKYSWDKMTDDTIKIYGI